MLPYIIITFPLAVFIVVYLCLAAVTLILAEITRCRQSLRRSSSNSSSNNSSNDDDSSALYVGQISHVRFLPVKHSFSYPIFMAFVDLEEDFQDRLWPLSTCMSLRSSDHYKNNEGGQEGSLLDRTFQLVKEKTNGSFTPTSETHKVKLLTHLCYYGYCFNPVSFYYVLNRTDGNEKIDAIVAEVSNTPWNEMYCYVLHKDSVDMKQVKPGRSKKQLGGTNYIFPKTFHVSPFMDMEHTYDWTFWEVNSNHNARGPLYVSTSMMKKPKSQSTDTTTAATTTGSSDNGLCYFNANLKINNIGLRPHRLAWQVISYPIFCMIIQLWIHYEAFWLFVKGVTYVPHPEESETAASRIIGNMMIPFFMLRDLVDSATKSSAKIKE